MDIFFCSHLVLLSVKSVYKNQQKYTQWMGQKLWSLSASFRQSLIIPIVLCLCSFWKKALFLSFQSCNHWVLLFRLVVCSSKLTLVYAKKKILVRVFFYFSDPQNSCVFSCQREMQMPELFNKGWLTAHKSFICF